MGHYIFFKPLLKFVHLFFSRRRSNRAWPWRRNPSGGAKTPPRPSFCGAERGRSPPCPTSVGRGSGGFPPPAQLRWGGGAGGFPPPSAQLRWGGGAGGFPPPSAQLRWGGGAGGIPPLPNFGGAGARVESPPLPNFGGAGAQGGPPMAYFAISVFGRESPSPPGEIPERAAC